MQDHGAHADRWRLANPDAIRVLRLDEAALVFNPLSWQTHYLNETASCLFDALRGGGKTLGELLAETVEAAASLDTQTREQWMRALQRHLDDLHLMGLVQRQRDAAA